MAAPALLSVIPRARSSPGWRTPYFYSVLYQEIAHRSQQFGGSDVCWVNARLSSIPLDAFTALLEEWGEEAIP